MYDLIRFPAPRTDPSSLTDLSISNPGREGAALCPASPALDPAPSSFECIDVRSLPASCFVSVPDVERARVVVKRSHLVHMPIWQPDVGLARLVGEHGAVMVLGLSDLLPLPPSEMGKRLARSAHMVSMVRHFGGSVRLASMARQASELRNPLELVCIGERLGLPARAVLDSIQAPIEV